MYSTLRKELQRGCVSANPIDFPSFYPPFSSAPPLLAPENGSTSSGVKRNIGTRLKQRRKKDGHNVSHVAHWQQCLGVYALTVEKDPFLTI